jgi:hypothetical protein
MLLHASAIPIGVRVFTEYLHRKDVQLNVLTKTLQRGRAESPTGSHLGGTSVQRVSW